jgi:hypothetical protein
VRFSCTTSFAEKENFLGKGLETIPEGFFILEICMIFPSEEGIDVQVKKLQTTKLQRSSSIFRF